MGRDWLLGQALLEPLQISAMSHPPCRGATGRSDGLKLVRRTCCAGAGAHLDTITQAGCGSAWGGGGRQRIGRTGVADAVAAFRGVADAGGGATDVGPLGIGRAGGGGAGAGLRLIARADRGAAGGPGVAGGMRARAGAIADVARTGVAVVGARRIDRLERAGGRAAIAVRGVAVVALLRAGLHTVAADAGLRGRRGGRRDVVVVDVDVGWSTSRGRRRARERRGGGGRVVVVVLGRVVVVVGSVVVVVVTGQPTQHARVGLRMTVAAGVTAPVTDGAAPIGTPGGCSWSPAACRRSSSWSSR